MGAYDKIEQVTVNSKYPFHNESGVHIVAIQGWSCRESRSPDTQGDMLDICEWQVVKTIAGDASAVGTTRARMRVLKRPGSLEEVKQRALVCSTAAGKAVAGPDFEFPAANVNGALLESITGNNGRQFVGLLVKIQANQTTTKKGQTFTAITYSLPTAADLDGIKVVNGRLAE